MNLDEFVDLVVNAEKQNEMEKKSSSWKNLSTTSTRKPWPTHKETSMPK